MRKTILMLINGFGIERKDSAEVYSANLMPNLDAMTKNYQFGSLTAMAGDYNNGYRLFSMADNSSKKDDSIDEMIYNNTLITNETLKNISSSIVNKLHVFYTIEKGSKFHQVKEILKVLNPSKDKKVFIHLIMTSTSLNDYDDIVKTISKISFETSEYAKIGFVVGKNQINEDDTLRAFYREFGEHWNESTKKFDILRHDVVNPEDAQVFSINNGFALQENDSVLFLNFDNIQMDRFYDDFTKVKVQLYSLYKLKEGVQNIFERDETNASSIADIVEKHGIKLLVLTDQSRINEINFYLNGMKTKKSPNITYAVCDLSLFGTKESVINLVEGNNFDGYILDFNIGLYNKMEDIKNTLSLIDTIIKPISDAATEKDYTFIISSLYGMQSQVTDGVVAKVVNFSGKVPVIYQNNEFNKSEYSLNSGSTYALAQTYLTNICDEVKSNKLLHKLSGLEKVLSKK